MPNDITSTNHGLSVLTNAAPSQRLGSPLLPRVIVKEMEVDRYITNCFNNATTGGDTEAFSSGHEGLDFACDVGNEVKAMYGGTVTVLTNEFYGLHVKIRPVTDQATTVGFEHLYAHLDSVADKFTGATPATTVKKGEEIGQSGMSGNATGPHLHVHVKPFDASGAPTHEFAPANATDLVILEYSYPPVATRIKGTMDFACFLPADHGGPAITADGLLLSARDSDARIPVYEEVGDTTSVDTIDGSKIGCYAVTDRATEGGSIWYKIQLASGHGWVSQMGDVGGQRVQWVRVENTMPAPLPARIAGPAASTNAVDTAVRSAPSTAATYLGALICGVRYAIQGSLWNPYYAVLDFERRWWQIDFNDTTKGWVRNDVVTEHGDLSGVPGAWPPAPAGLQTDPRGATVRLTWSAPAWPAGTPEAIRILTGYRIERYEPSSAFSPGAPTAFSEVSATTHTWTDTTVAAVPQALVYYRVAAQFARTVGISTRYRSATPGVTTTNPDPNPGTSRAEEVWSELATVALPSRPQGPAPGAQVALRRTARATAEAILLPSRDAALADILAEVHLPPSGSSASGSAQTRAAARSAERVGWVPMSVLTGTSDWAPRVRALPQPPFVRVTAPGAVPVRPGPSLGYTEYVAQIERSGGWYALIGKNGSWWQVRVAASTVGWLRAQDVETTHRDTLTAVPFVDESPAPEPAGPGGTLPSGHAVTRDSGHYLNLANSWGGAWAVSKAGREVTAAFQSTRSPVQWYARQNPQDLAVLPVDFRPTVTQDIPVTGVHVTDTGVDYAGSPPAPFTLRVSTTGQVRYVDGAELDHVGFLRYEIGTAESGVSVTWRTATAVVEPVDPTPPGDLSASGTYHNRQVNWGSRWALAREGDAVSGTFTTTRSPAEYYANDENPEALLWLPGEYWPDQDARFRVTGAVRVNEDGTDSPDTRLVNFWITVQRSDGRMYYDPDTALEAAGVGYVRYTVDVDWTAAARLTVPSAPQELEVDDVAAEEVELDWDRPADDGGDSVDEYRVEIYRGGRWRTEEDDISRTSYTVEDLDPYTTYTFRVAAHNAAGWGPASAEVAVTTRRAEPGQPRSLAAAATHDRVTLTWQAPTAGGRVTGYRVQRRVGSGSYRVVVADTGSAVTYWVDRDVSPATTYSYAVRALNYGEEGNSSGSETVITRAAPTIPGRPTALRVAPSAQSQLQLTWMAPAATGGGVTGYRIERSPDELPRVWTEVVADTRRTARVWDAPELAADTTYHYQVSARNSAGVSLPSAEAQGQTRPQLRLDLPVVYPLTAQAAPRADAAVTATFGFFLPERTYDLVGQVPGADGWWQVLLFGQTAQGPFWLPARAGTALGATAALPQLPAAPESFTATLARGAVALSWTAPLTGGPVSGYRLWRQQDDAAFAPLGADLAAAALTYTDSTVQHGHVYRYWLQALADPGPGLPSPTVALAVMATPAAPAAVPTVNVAATSRTLQLDWTRAATGGLPSGYRLQWRRGGTTDDFQTVEVPGTTHTLVDLIPGTAYEFQVTAFNQEGDAPATAQTGTTVQVAPGVPETLEVAVSGQDATVTWAVPRTGGRADAYHLQYKTQATADWPAVATTVAGLTHSLSGLGYEVAHDLRVRAHNTAGESDWVIEIFTTAARPRVPGIPTALAATPSADSQLQLSWQAAAAGSAATGYRLERSPDTTPREWVVIEEDTGSTAVTWDEAGLAASTVYHYRVTGRNAEGLGTPSGEATGTTRPQLALLATAPYPLTAHAWPAAPAPVTHTWLAHDAMVQLDLVGQGAHGDWYRALRFGQAASGPYWLPASAVTTTGSTTGLAQAPGVPGDLAPPTATHDRVTLSWSTPTTGGPVTGYRLWRQTAEGAFMALGPELAADPLTFTDSTVAASTAYQYRVQAMSAAGAGPRGVAVAVTTAEMPRVPGLPTDLTAQPLADSHMQLAWRAPLDPGTQPLSGYRIERAVDAMPLVWMEVVADTGTLDLIWDDSALDASTVYHYRVSAHNAVGVGNASPEATGTARPQLALSASAPYPLTAHQWPAATAPVTHTWPAFDAMVHLDLVAQDASGSWYRALRFGQGASGPYWLPASAVIVSGTTTVLPQTPGVPGALQTPDTQGQVTLTWTAPPSGGTVTGYRLWRQTAEASWSVVTDSLPAGTLTYADSAVMTDSTYQYRLQAQSAAGYGPRTAAVSAVVTIPPPPPADPTYVAAAQVGATTVQLAWDPVPGATHYDVELRQSWYAADHVEARVRLPLVGTVALRTGPETTDTVTVTVLRTGTLTELTGLPASYTYWDLYVRATNVGGPSAWVEMYVSNDPTALLPRQPTGLRGQRSATGTAALHWDAVAGAADYRVYFDFPNDDQGAAGWDWLPYRGVELALTDTTATVSGLPTTPATWGLRVSARNAAGAESVRSTALAVSTAEAPRVPGLPTALTVAPGADSQLQLSWSAPADAGTQPLSGYRIERAADVLPRVWTEVLADSGHLDLTWSDRGLAAATTYHYQVSARNAVGVGQPAAPTSGQTRPQVTLLATAPYPVMAHQGPAATAPVTHTWLTHDAAVRLDLVAQAAGGSWWRVLRFGHSASGPYWLPAAAVTVTGSTTDVPAVPDAPTALTAQPTADSQMELRWVAAATGGPVTGYRIERSADVLPRVWTEMLADSGSPAVTWRDRGLDASTVYHYQVTGRNAEGLGTPAVAATGTTRPQLALLATTPYPLTAHQWPAAPAPVTHTWLAHDARVHLDLVAQGPGGGWYRALRFGQGASGPYWLPASAVTTTGSTTSLAQAPGVPGDLAPPTATHDRVTLSWSAPTTGGPVTGYRLWRQTAEEAFVVLGIDLAADVLTHMDLDVTASTAYQYRVQAMSAAGAGPRGVAVAVTTAETPRVPGLPPALAAQPTADSQMTLSWTAPPDTGTQPLSGYRIERSADVLPRVWMEVVADTGTTDVSWSDSGLAAATTYHYQVRARNAVGGGDPATAQGTTRPQLTLLATAPYPLMAHQWPAATAPVTHTWPAYDAMVHLDLVAQGPGGGGWYRALRFGHGAAGPYWLPASAVTTTGSTSGLPQAPGTPGDLQTTDTLGQVTLIWNAPPTGGTVTGYRLWRQSGEGPWAALDVVLAAHTLSHTDTTVTIDSTYQYRLQAQSAAGYGPRSAPLTAAVTPPPPADLTYVAVAQVGATTVQLAWDPVPGATHYDVELRQSWYAADHVEARVRLPLAGTVTLRTGPETTDTVPVTVLRTGTLVELTGLPASYSYWDLYVRATNAGGHSAWVEMYVYNDPTALLPRQPTGLRGQRSATGTAALHWDAVAGATAYRVYFDFPDDDQGAAGWDWLPYRGVELTLAAATATVSSLPTMPATWGLRVSARNAAGAESVRAAALTVANPPA